VETLHIVIIGIVTLVALLVKYYKPKIKGFLGEVNISLRLKKLKSKEYKVLNDLLIVNKSRSSQIDHVIVSVYGIFVIETKNYKGWIFGNEKTNRWTQVLYKNKYKFRNPISQCWGHINTLKTVLPEFSKVLYNPIVVFTGTAKLKKITSSVPVIRSRELIRCIVNFSSNRQLSHEEVDRIYQRLVELNRKDKILKKSHVRKAKANRGKSVKMTTCPRCGGRLDQKQGKHGMFYGCSNYPKCTFTKKHND
jgi:hypothetical protein